MCNLSEIILEKGLVKGREKGLEEGKTLTLCELVQQGLLSVNDAAKNMGVDVDTFRDKALQNGFQL